MKGPGRAWILPIRLAIANMPARTTENLRLTIPSSIGESRRFIIDDVKNVMALPVTFSAFGIFVPGSIQPRKAINQNIRPAISVEVIRERQKVIRVGIVDPQTTFKARHDL